MVDTLPLPLGTSVPHYGMVAAVQYHNGERYYLLTKGGDVALMPAAFIEQIKRGFVLYRTDDHTKGL